MENSYGWMKRKIIIVKIEMYLKKAKGSTQFTTVLLAVGISQILTLCYPFWRAFPVLAGLRNCPRINTMKRYNVFWAFSNLIKARRISKSLELLPLIIYRLKEILWEIPSAIQLSDSHIYLQRARE